MDFKLGELEELFGVIQDNMDYFEETGYYKKGIIIYLSNGDKIYLKVPKESIAHLLGININYLQTIGCFKSTNAFDLLKDLTDNAYKINSLKNQGVLSYDYLFSPYINDKIKSFKENIKVNIYETEFACKYDSKKAYIKGQINHKYDYIIVKKFRGTDNYEVLCLAKNIDNHNNEYYVPMSNQFFDSYGALENNLKDILENQEITLINNVKVLSYNKEFPLELETKRIKLGKLRNYKEKFNCSIDVVSDLEFSLSETMKHINNHFNDNEVIEKMVESIISNKLIDSVIPNNAGLSKVIDAYNDCLASNSVGNSEVSEEFTKTKKELLELRAKVVALEKENKDLTNTNNELLEFNKKILEEHRNYDNDRQVVLKILTKQKFTLSS